MSGATSEGEPTRIEVKSKPFEAGICECHNKPRIVAKEDYLLNLHGRAWIIAGLYVARCSVEPNNEMQALAELVGTDQALEKMFGICFPERANWPING